MRAASALAAILIATGLAGCISVLPKTRPVQLYRFGVATTVAAPPPAGAPLAAVALVQVSLPQASRGDGILTAAGDQAAYLAGARWAAPAEVLFREDALRAFDASARCARLLDRGEIGSADALLRLDVTRFEARYDTAKPDAPPKVQVAARATLSRPDGSRLRQAVFSREAAAAQNRVGAIVAAFDQAVDGVLQDLAAWTDQAVPPSSATPGDWGAHSRSQPCPEAPSKP